MSDGEQRALTTLAVRDLVVQPRIQDSNLKFEYEESDVFKEVDEFGEMHMALFDDNKEEFLRLVKSPRLQKMKGYIGAAIISEAAVKCAAAVLAGETNGIISPDFGFGLTAGRWTVIHRCAACFCSEILAMFLQRGFSADIRSDWKPLNLKHQLPLNVTLRQLRYRYLKGFWGSQKRSAGRLLMELCKKADLLEIVTLLALNTREFKHEFFNYAKEGKMVEVGALLLAAGEKLMPLCISEGEDVIVFNSFKEISHFLQAKYPWSAMSRDESREMKETLLLLDIYDKIGNQLTAYARPKEKGLHQISGLEVATLLEAAGFDVIIEDLDFQDYVNRSNSSSFEWRVPQICAPRELDKLFCEQSQQPSIPTRHLFHTSSFRNIDSKYASLTPAKKLVTCKRWVSFMTIFRKGVRLV